MAKIGEFAKMDNGFGGVINTLAIKTQATLERNPWRCDAVLSASDAERAGVECPWAESWLAARAESKRQICRRIACFIRRNGRRQETEFGGETRRGLICIIPCIAEAT